MSCDIVSSNKLINQFLLMETKEDSKFILEKEGSILISRNCESNKESLIGELEREERILELWEVVELGYLWS